MKKDIKGNNKPIYKKWWFWVLIILFIVILSPKNNSNSSSAYNTSTQNEASEKPKTTDAEDTTNENTLKYDVKTADVMNGSKTEAIGEYAYIEIKKSELTNEALLEIYRKEIENKNYNWFTIKFEDGTGILFGGCLCYGNYGNIGQDGGIDGESRDIDPTYNDEGSINGFELRQYIYEKLKLKDEEIRTIGNEWTDASSNFNDTEEFKVNTDKLEKKYIDKYSLSEEDARTLLEECETWNLYH